MREKVGFLAFLKIERGGKREGGVAGGGKWLGWCGGGLGGVVVVEDF